MSKTGRLGWNQLLFAVEGRATRFDYWMRWVLPYFIGALIAAFLDDVLGTVNPTGGVGVIMVIYIIAAVWPNLAVGIKRCHDRGRSGWFLLIGLVPLLNLWLAVELMFLRGTVGLNRFGPDPLDGVAVAAAGITT
ncbi:MAG: DUF805 domain-containing protein [Stellaceae bacterium]